VFVSQNSTFPTPALERVREGMTVIDESGRRLGTVARVRMGDPQAVTTQSEQPPSGDPGVVVAPTAEAGGPTGLGFVGPVLGAGPGGLDVPDSLRHHLLRTGFVEVDGPDLEGPARYVPGDRVADVSDGTVHLRAAAGSTTTPTQAGTSGSAVVEPVLRTDLGAPRQSSRPVPQPVLLGAAAAAVLGGVAGTAWLVWRRRQARRQPLNRLLRLGRTLADTLATPGRAGVGSLAGGLVLIVLLARVLRRPAPAEGRPPRRSVTLTLSLPALPSGLARPRSGRWWLAAREDRPC
jgi:hypothetical protein